MHVLYKSSGGHQIALPLHGSAKAMELVNFPYCYCINSLSSRSKEHDSRQSQLQVPAEPRMGDEPSGTTKHIQMVRDTDYKLICHLPEQQISTLLFQGRPQTTLLRGHSPSLMGQRPSICISPISSIAESQVKKKESKCHTDCFHLAKTDLVSLAVMTGNMFTNPSATHSIPTLAKWRTHSPPQPAGTLAQGLTPSWFQHIERCCMKVQEVLLHSRKSATWRIYLQKWTRFQIWCDSRQITLTCYSPNGLGLCTDSQKVRAIS